MNSERVSGLAKAIYRVTDRLNDEEPLKWRLRKTSLALSDIVDSKDLLEEERVKLFAGSVESMLRTLDLAASISYVSRINFEALYREYSSLSERLLLLQSKTKSSIRPEIKTAAEEKWEAQATDVVKKEAIISSEERQKKILSILLEAGEISIGELNLHIGQAVSEKTIQRDLADLIEQGKIAARGEKRWRKYFVLK